MIGFSHSFLSVLNDRADHLRDVAARETIANTAHRAAKAAFRASRRQEAAHQAVRDQQLALFSWESHSELRRDSRRGLGHRLAGRAR